MKKVEDIWFKRNSEAREWLSDNIEFEDSFSKTFRTAGGTFEYYKYEYVMRRCIINYCHEQAVGSFATNGGVKINLCENHLEHLMYLQIPTKYNMAFWPIFKIGLIELGALITQLPFFNFLHQLAQHFAL